MTAAFGASRRGVALLVLDSARAHVERRSHVPAMWPSDVVDRVLGVFAASWAKEHGLPAADALEAVVQFIESEGGS